MKWKVSIKHFCCIPKPRGCLEGQRALTWLSCKLNYPPFHRTAFLLEKMTNKLWLFRLGYSSDMPSKMKKVSLSLQRQWLMVFVTSDKNWAFKQKSEFWKTCFGYCELGSFLIFDEFLMKPVEILTNTIFWRYVMKCVNIWKICIIQRTYIFQLIDALYYKTKHGQKIYSKCKTD